MSDTLIEISIPEELLEYINSLHKHQKDAFLEAIQKAEIYEWNKFWSFGKEFELYVGEDKEAYYNKKRNAYDWRGESPPKDQRMRLRLTQIEGNDYTVTGVYPKGKYDEYIYQINKDREKYEKETNTKIKHLKHCFDGNNHGKDFAKNNFGNAQPTMVVK